ncbi:MAG: imidazole glycerol phosphate synthase subunit HisF [Candidatus Nealsonbacteria bacterium]|nr:imidazole glycerol phosphate synthase subunit HisF [Candidatus Nealsonbacteria bacterium]
MLKKRIIPLLLLKGGRCVKGVNFSNHRDVGHPVTNARIYQHQGADELIFLDIEAENEKRRIDDGLVEKVSQECFMPFCAGGGIKTVEDIRNLLRAGADKVAINTQALKNPGFIAKAAESFGSQCIVVSIDYKLNKIGRNEVFVSSGKEPTGKDPILWAKEARGLGAGEILLTNIDREGTRKGYDLEILQKVSDSLNIPVIASGGAGTLEDLMKAITNGHASAVSLGTILHFTDQNVIKARNYLYTHSVNVRIYE